MKRKLLFRQLSYIYSIVADAFANDNSSVIHLLDERKTQHFDANLLFNSAFSRVSDFISQNMLTLILSMYNFVQLAPYVKYLLKLATEAEIF